MLYLCFIASALYLLVAWRQLHRISEPESAKPGLFFELSSIALVLHAIVAISAIRSPEGINLGLFKISALMSLIVNLSFLISLWRRPLHNLAILLYPLASLSLLTATLAPGNTSPLSDLPGGMLLHIGSSILAYAVLTLAACQAAALALLDYQLRHRHTRGIVQILPPLELMETMLFEIIWLGLGLLSISILSGAVFLDDMFAQSLAHKTVLTLCAWLVFAVLLWGRHQLGWRSQTAVRFTLSGFAVLMLAYFGSKLVLEVILQRV